jgi:exportin-2 (importin alpha re-exporter)
MSQLESILLNTLSSNAIIRKESEMLLIEFQLNPINEFSNVILNLIINQQLNLSIRQSATLTFKNFIKLNYAQEDAIIPLTTNDANFIKQNIINIMLQLNNTPILQSQIIATIDIIATLDFPDNWNDLINQLISNLSSNNFIQNNAILNTAHQIFRRYYSLPLNTTTIN